MSQSEPELDSIQKQHTSRLGTTNVESIKYDDDTFVSQPVNNNNKRLLAHNHDHEHHNQDGEEDANLNSSRQYNKGVSFANETSSTTSTAPNQPGTIWPRAIWPTTKQQQQQQQQLPPGSIELTPPHIILIQWALVIGILLAIVLLLVILLKKLLSSPSYHWMLAKQMIKSTSNRLGPNGVGATTNRSSTTLEANNDCCYRLAPPPHHKGYINNNNSSLVFNSPFNCGNALLVAETTSDHSTPTSNIKTQICYNCQHHLQSSSKNNINNTTTTSSSLNNIGGASTAPVHCVIDSNGRHANVSSFLINNGARFNTDNTFHHSSNQIEPPSYIYASMTQSSDLSQNFIINKKHQRDDTTNNSINLSDNNNYDTLNNTNIYSNSLGYDDPINLIPERDKGFILSKDFVVLPTTPATKSNSQLNYISSNHDRSKETITTTTNTQSVDRLQTKNKSIGNNNNKAIIAPTVLLAEDKQH